ncbi:hypothetical protein [Gordonia terrae]|uniref:hypothetical protein n=1 Tax=Gordonia terrae TaxID=2055 RepID=UPI003F6CA10F
MTVTGGRRISAVQRAVAIDRELSAAGWLTMGLTDFCPDCTSDDDTESTTRPQLRIVRD